MQLRICVICYFLCYHHMSLNHSGSKFFSLKKCEGSIRTKMAFYVLHPTCPIQTVLKFFSSELKTGHQNPPPSTHRCHLRLKYLPSLDYNSKVFVFHTITGCRWDFLSNSFILQMRKLSPRKRK